MGILDWLFCDDKNKIRKMKYKEQIGDKTIIKTSYEVLSEEEQMKIDSTCPECGKYHVFNGGITDGTYNYYTCHYCKCKWKVKKK